MEEEQIVIARKDMAQGYADFLIEVTINASTRTLKNKQDIIIFEHFPALCRSTINGVTVWEKQIETAEEISWELIVGITDEIAQVAGLEKPAPTIEIKARPVESKQSARIKRLLEANKVEKERLNGVSACWLLAFIVMALSGIACGFDRSFTAMFVFLGLSAICGFLAWDFKTMKPPACAKCGAPTIETVSSSEKFQAIRSEQKLIHNTLTKEQEQRTVTVTDFQVTDTWECASCLHSWRHSYTVTRD